MNGSWRAALRVARREVWRAKGRSALVAAMVGVPVLLLTTTAVLLGTVAEAQSEQAVLLRQLGAAEANVIEAVRTPVAQDPFGRTVPAGGGVPPDEGSRWTERELAEAIGGRVLPVRTGGALVRTDTGALSARVREVDLRDPLAAGLAEVTEGRAPRDVGEVAVSRAVADRGYGPGATLRLVDGGDRTVVGVVRNPGALKESELVGLPGSVLPDDVEATYLVDTAGAEVSWSRVRELNGLGLTVLSRAVLLDPPPDDQVPPEVLEPEISPWARKGCCRPSSSGASSSRWRCSPARPSRSGPGGSAGSWRWWRPPAAPRRTSGGWCWPRASCWASAPRWPVPRSGSPRSRWHCR